MKTMLFISLLIYSILCSAAVYMQTDKNGGVTYSDTPTQGAQIIPLPDTNTPSTITSAPTPSPANKKDAPEAPFQEQTISRIPYTKFVIDSPIDNQTITNQNTSPVVLMISPDLQKGDAIQLYVDGTAVGSPAATTNIELPRIDRGTHQLYAVLLDESNHPLKQSQTITVNIHYAHLGTSGN
jgi:hypothetical protein